MVRAPYTPKSSSTRLPFPGTGNIPTPKFSSSHPLGLSSPWSTPQGGGPMYYKTPPIFSSKVFINS